MEYYYIHGIQGINTCSFGDIVKITQLSFGRVKLEFQNAPKLIGKTTTTADDGNSIIVYGKGWSLWLRPFYNYSDDDLINYMKGPHSNCFVQTNHNANTLWQMQFGWKIHISAYNYAEYMYLLNRLVPYLQSREYIVYKVVKPSVFNRFYCGGIQDGKFITIYVTNWHMLYDISQELMDILGSENGIPVKGELHLGGLLYARYGEYVRGTLRNPYTGQLEQDVRGIAHPYWVQPLDINQVF